jgi:hypothetical protein
MHVMGFDPNFTRSHLSRIELEDGRTIFVRRLRVSWGPRRWALNWTGLIALTLPWNAIWVQKEHFGDTILHLHEDIHLRQMHRDGRIRFLIRYFWQLGRIYWRGGSYVDIDYEREAYENSCWKFRPENAHWPGNVHYVAKE